MCKRQIKIRNCTAINVEVSKTLLYNNTARAARQCTYRYGDQGVDRRILLKWILQEESLGLWTEFMWLRTVTGDRLLTRQWTFWFHKRREISWLTQCTMTFEEHCFTHSVSLSNHTPGGGGGFLWELGTTNITDVKQFTTSLLGPNFEISRLMLDGLLTVVGSHTSGQTVLWLYCYCPNFILFCGAFQSGII